MTGELLTPREVAQMFRVDPKTVTRWAVAGRLRSIKTPGGHRRFVADDVRALLETIEPTRPVAPTLTCYRCGGTGGTVLDRGTGYGKARYMHSLESCPGSLTNGGPG
jgi:excisionase family DNA binding protein